MSELDEKLTDSTARLLKAAIPYADHKHAKALAVAAKFLELKKAFGCLNDDSDELSICSVSGKKPAPEELLLDLKKYCEPSQAEVIDKMLNLLKMGKLYEKYQELSQSPEFSKILNSLGSLGGSFTPNGEAGPLNHAHDNPQNHNNFFNAGTHAASCGSGYANRPSGSASYSPPSNSMPGPDMENSLKAMLTPEQLELFERLKSTMNQPPK